MMLCLRVCEDGFTLSGVSDRSVFSFRPSVPSLLPKVPFSHLTKGKLASHSFSVIWGMKSWWHQPTWKTHSFLDYCDRTWCLGGGGTLRIIEKSRGHSWRMCTVHSCPEKGVSFIMNQFPFVLESGSLSTQEERWF